jgi:predicted transcriptional regulator
MGREAIGFLARTSRRAAIFEAVRRSAPDLRGLVDDLDLPRSTVYDNLDAMIDRGWIVETTDGGYRTTPLGERIVDAYLECLDRVETAGRLEPFLSYLPAGTPVDLAALSDATLVVPEAGRPYKPIERVVELIRRADRVLGAAPVVTPQYASAFRSRVVGTDVTVELVFERDAAAALEEFAAYRELFEAPEDLTDRFRVGLYDGDLPYGLAVIDDTVVLKAFDDDDIPRVLVRTDERAARRWALHLYHRYRRDAEPLIGEFGGTQAPTVAVNGGDPDD